MAKRLEFNDEMVALGFTNNTPKSKCFTCSGYKTPAEMLDSVTCLECFREQQALKPHEQRIHELELEVQSLRTSMQHHSHLSNTVFG